MSFAPIFFEGTFITKDTGTDVSVERLSNSSTLRACPDGMWSITVPFLIAVTLRMLCSSAIKPHLFEFQQELQSLAVDKAVPYGLQRH